jgi:hypothetical protein
MSAIGSKQSFAVALINQKAVGLPLPYPLSGSYQHSWAPEVQTYVEITPCQQTV